MRKLKIINTSFIFFSIFQIIFFLSCQEVFSSEVLNKSNRKRTVVIIRYRIEPNFFSTVVRGLKTGLSERGYIEGKNVRFIDVLTDTADEKSIPLVIETVKRYQNIADLFVTCGWISMWARKILKGKEIPQLFCPVLKSVALKMLTSVDCKPGTNLSGVYLMYPPEKLLRISRLILPKAKVYAYVYDSRIPADSIFKLAFQGLIPQKMHGFKVIFLDLSKGVEEVLKEMKAKKVDVYGGIVGAFKTRRELNFANIPMITALTLDVERKDIPLYVKGSNILAGLFDPFSYCGHEAGKMAADIFEGKKTIYEMRPRPARQVAFINMKCAKRLDIYIPFRALEAVDLVVR